MNNWPKLVWLAGSSPETVWPSRFEKETAVETLRFPCVFKNRHMGKYGKRGVIINRLLECFEFVFTDYGKAGAEL